MTSIELIDTKPLSKKYKFKHPRVVVDGFLFIFDKKCLRYIRWRCYNHKNMMCGTILKTNRNLQQIHILDINYQHTHDNISVRKVIEDLKTKVWIANRIR